MSGILNAAGRWVCEGSTNPKISVSPPRPLFFRFLVACSSPMAEAKGALLERPTQPPVNSCLTPHLVLKNRNTISVLNRSEGRREKEAKTRKRSDSQCAALPHTTAPSTSFSTRLAAQTASSDSWHTKASTDGQN